MEKKAAAALAAVTSYLEMEESLKRPGNIPQPPQAQPSQWIHSGRQEMMAMRRLLQIRTFTTSQTARF